VLKRIRAAALWQARQVTRRFAFVVSVRDPNGRRFYGRMSDDQHLAAIRRGGVEPITLQLMREAISPGDTVVDLGVHLGVHTVTAAVAAGPTGQVLAVEADSAAVELVNRTLRANALQRVTVLHAAAGARTGLAYLRRRADQSSNTTVDAKETDHPVVVVAIDDIIDSVDVVKMDIEGAELPAIDGMTRLLRQARLFIVECSEGYLAASGATPADLAQRILGDLGFTSIEVVDERRGTRTAWPAEVGGRHVNFVCRR
jgi:FkbM family methyltransferase